ncbi:hypothetical protein M404DRAFT_759673 [Pisolithus tinctorius Marx 270]|uniref:Uncharacterized protein n=1 Tax=Pisolithus tinctorius Marx 270 TaxID=870435 RepID=A0A0C3P031_PISTI|nr:hypothetical protein M404DRAFT_759673 [Pisolithus tinctorius Marx 270]
MDETVGCAEVLGIPENETARRGKRSLRWGVVGGTTMRRGERGGGTGGKGNVPLNRRSSGDKSLATPQSHTPAFLSFGHQSVPKLKPSTLRLVRAQFYQIETLFSESPRWTKLLWRELSWLG